MATILEPIAVTATEQIATKALSLADRAKQIVIRDQATFDKAQEMLQAVCDMKREAIAHHEPIKKASWNAHQVNLAAEKRVVDPLLAAEQVLRPAITGYLQEQERIRLDNERRAREEAARLQREADEAARVEQSRLEAEARAVAEAEQLAAAVQAEAEGAAPEEVTAILEQPVYVPPVYVPPAPVFVAPVSASMVQRAAGISAPRANWSAEVVSLEALVKFVGEVDATGKLVRPECIGLLLPNNVALNQMAKAQKNLMRIPGVEARNNPHIAVGRSKY